MAETWAHIDTIKLEARARATVNDRMREEYRKQRALTGAQRNVERWFRELPPDLVQAMCSESTGVLVYDAGPLIVANDWLLDHGFGPKTHRPLRPPSSRELLLIHALKACRFPPASFAKRFVREIGETAITDGQAAQLRRLVRRFRRQIPQAALHEADRHLLNKAGRR